MPLHAVPRRRTWLMHPLLEALEDRTAPAADPLFDAVSGTLTLHGDDADNLARVSLSGGMLQVEQDGRAWGWAGGGLSLSPSRARVGTTRWSSAICMPPPA